MEITYNTPDDKRFILPIPMIVGDKITFNGSKSSDKDGSIVNYLWNFGDGSPLFEGVKIEHIYEKDGIYNVKLTVIDNDGKIAVIEKSITIHRVPKIGLEVHKEDYVVIIKILSIFNGPVNLWEVTTSVYYETRVGGVGDGWGLYYNGSTNKSVWGKTPDYIISPGDYFLLDFTNLRENVTFFDFSLHYDGSAGSHNWQKLGEIPRHYF
ncbi:MAG: PKD domain-containing protein [Candidatus Thermoplasmatota archaeon]